MSRKLLLCLSGVLTIAALIGSREVPIQAAPPSADLDQCRNGAQLSPVQCIGGAWVNGNAGAQNAHWNEGESIAYRMRFSNLAINIEHTLTIEFDTTQGGKHALDYLTSFDRTEVDADPCSNVTGCSVANAPATAAIPDNPATGLSGSTSVDHDAGRWGNDATPPSLFKLFNAGTGGITFVDSYIMSSGSYLPTGSSSTGNSSTKITIKFTTSTPNPVLAWGAHIATRADWGISESAIAISGSPYHMRLVAFDGSGGNQDRSLSSAAAIFPALLTIVKAVKDPAGTDATASTKFDFTSVSQQIPGDGMEIDSALSLWDDGGTGLPATDNTPDRRSYKLYLFDSANTKTVTELVPSGFDESVSCVESSGGLGSTANSSPKSTDSAATQATPTATIIAEEGELITCTFVNKIQSATLILVKNVTRDNGGSAAANSFPIHVTLGGVDITTNGGSPFFVTNGATTATGTKTLSVPAGTYIVSENSADNNFPAGYENTSITCTGGTTGTGGSTAVLAAGGTATCTVENNDKTPKLTLNKIVVKDNGGNKSEGDWTIRAVKVGDATEKIEGVGKSGSDDVVSGSTFKFGTYNLSESWTGTGSDPGYTSSGFSCAQVVGGTPGSYGAVVTQVTVGLGEEWICKVTNDDPLLTPTAETDQRVILHDSITMTNVVRGASDAATGDNNKVTFKLYPNATCTAGTEVYTEGPVALTFASGSATTGTATTGTLAGKTGYLFDPAVGQPQSKDFYWQVFYKGDSSNGDKTTSCGTGAQGGEKTSVTLDPK